MNTIYVVIGECGEYSDHQDWPVCAYTDEAQAKEHVERASEYARVAWLRQQKQWSREQLPNPYDPDMDLAYTGASYGYWHVSVCETTEAFMTVTASAQEGPDDDD